MSRLNSPDELERLRKSIVDSRDPNKPCIVICGGTGCLALGGTGDITAFKQEVEQRGLGNKVDLRITGCPGFCERGPLVTIEPKNILYQRVKSEDVGEIVSQTIEKGNIVDRLLYHDPQTNSEVIQESDVPFYQKQKRLLLGDNSRIDPNNIEDYLAVGGYSALAKVLSKMSQEQVIDEVKLIRDGEMNPLPFVIRVFQLAIVERAARSFRIAIQFREQAGSMFYLSGSVHN